MRVPKPYNFHDGVLLMELVTDADGDAAPRLDRLEGLAARAAGAIARRDAFAGTLAGALVSVTQAGRLVVAKAPPRRPRTPEGPSEA